MKALILVGGFGTRLRPLTLTTPKQMLPIGGRPMIEWVVARLGRLGAAGTPSRDAIDEVVLSLGYRPDAFLDAYPDGTIAGLPYRCAVEPEPRGTAGAVRFTADEVEIDDTFFVLNGDVLTDLDLGALLAFHRSSGAQATIALQPVDDPSRFGVVPTDEDGRVQAFIEKPEPGTEPTNLINAGTYVLEPSVIDLIPPGTEVSIERETFPALVEAGSLYAMGADTYWLDTGTPAQFLEANLDLLSGRRPGHTIEPSDHPGTAGSVIGEGCTIGAAAVVERSVVMSGCSIADGAIIRDSILANGVSVGEGAIVDGGSVIGAGEQVPAGARLHEVRQPAP